MRKGMEDAKRFAQLARRNGMRVGTYIGGTMLYERLFEAEPNAWQWQSLTPRGEPICYGDQTFRRTSVRNHPDFIEYLKKPVRFAVEEVRTDLVHFDNFGCGAASYDPFSKQQFREYLRNRGLAPCNPPSCDEPNSKPLVRAWKDYKCQALTDHYAAMSRYIRSLNPQCAVECNSGAVGGGAYATVGIDPTRLLPLGNAFWDESFGAGWSEKDGAAQTRVRTLKVGELYNNSAFLYCESALDLAESMAFNVNCLGCVAWFEWGELIAAHQQSGKPPSRELKPYIRFFLDHQDLYRRWAAVADVAVLRTFAEQNFGPQRFHAVEQALIQGHAAWRMIFDQQLDHLEGCRAGRAGQRVVDGGTTREDHSLRSAGRSGRPLGRHPTAQRLSRNGARFVAGCRGRASIGGSGASPTEQSATDAGASGQLQCQTAREECCGETPPEGRNPPVRATPVA